MNAAYHIRYVVRRDIDLEKWDACIDQAPNGLIYARSHYLDHMATGQWDALVLDDYKAVMPLPWKRKWGITYLYQPPYTQQSGIFGGNGFGKPPAPPASQKSPDNYPGSEITPALIAAFLAVMAKHIRFAQIFLNYANGPGEPIHNAFHGVRDADLPPLRPHTNFILPLDASYDQLAGRYKRGLTGSLRMAANAHLRYTEEQDVPAALRLNKEQYRHRTPHVTDKDYERLEKLCLFLQDRGQVIIRTIRGKDSQLLALALLLHDRDRLYLLQVTSLPEGRPLGANHLLLDYIIREWAGQYKTLDFEGSDIPGIAHFWRSFGAIDQPYYFYRHNQLPWPLRWLK